MFEAQSNIIVIITHTLYKKRDLQSTIQYRHFKKHDNSLTIYTDGTRTKYGVGSTAVIQENIHFQKLPPNYSILGP